MLVRFELVKNLHHFRVVAEQQAPAELQLATQCDTRGHGYVHVALDAGQGENREVSVSQAQARTEVCRTRWGREGRQRAGTDSSVANVSL